MIMSLAWNFPLKLSSSTIFRGAESLTSDHVMSPNKLFSCDCNFYATLLKDKSPVYHVFSGRALKMVTYMKGRAGSLNEHYPITANVPNLDFLTGC